MDPSETSTHIPLRAYFIWFGRHFPWVNLLALRSAALRGGFDQVVLYHDSDLASTPYYRGLLETPRVTLERLDLGVLLERCEPHASALREVYGRLRTPAMRSDLVRLALLYGQGGVYLDIDTVTLKSFEPLCRVPSAFCGQERIVYPASVRASRNSAVKLGAQLRSRLRDGLRRLPKGYRLFRAIEGLYPKAENNAILASARRGPFVENLLCNLKELAPTAQSAPYGIGPHLLQRTVANYRGTDLVVHPPEVFFPLGPEISEHWFRKVRHADLDQVLSPATRLVHWYASVRSKHLVPQIDAEYVRHNAEIQLFSALALPFASP